jgi:hypothetical protein
MVVGTMPYEGGYNEFSNELAGKGNQTWGSVRYSKFSMLFIGHCLTIFLKADDWVTLSLCAPANESMTLWITALPYVVGEFDLSVTSNGMPDQFISSFCWS